MFKMASGKIRGWIARVLFPDTYRRLAQLRATIDQIEARIAERAR